MSGERGVGVGGPESVSRLCVSAVWDRGAELKTDRSAVEVMLVSARERLEPSPSSELVSSKLGSKENFEPVKNITYHK
jgi:hypothetical protein